MRSIVTAYRQNSSAVSGEHFERDNLCCQYVDIAPTGWTHNDGDGLHGVTHSVQSKHYAEDGVCSYIRLYCT